MKILPKLSILNKSSECCTDCLSPTSMKLYFNMQFNSIANKSSSISKRLTLKDHSCVLFLDNCETRYRYPFETREFRFYVEIKLDERIF